MDKTKKNGTYLNICIETPIYGNLKLYAQMPDRQKQKLLKDNGAIKGRKYKKV